MALQCTTKPLIMGMGANDLRKNGLRDSSSLRFYCFARPCFLIFSLSLFLPFFVLNARRKIIWRTAGVNTFEYPRDGIAIFFSYRTFCCLNYKMTCSTGKHFQHLA